MGVSFDGGPRSSSMYLLSKCVVWLILGALAEIPPVVCCRISYTCPLCSNVHPCSMMQVLILLDMSGSPLPSITYHEGY